MSTRPRKFGGVEGLFFHSGSTSGILSISISGIITKYANENALDEYKLSLDPSTFNFISSEKYIYREEEFTTKRVRGRGRRITLRGAELTIRDRTGKQKVLKEEDVSKSTSGLALLRRLGQAYEAEQVEEIAQLFESLRLIDISVSAVRLEGRAEDNARLRADGSNIAPFLLRLKSEFPSSFEDIEDDLRHIHPLFEKFVIEPYGSGGQYCRILIKERSFEEPIPLDRASFGTIRGIVLFTMLHDPDPPKLTCVEEIDHGFHPQALDRLVERLREASKRTQIIVATHSPALVNRLRTSELMMFMRDIESGASQVLRPNASLVNSMKEMSGFNLGELWFSGLLSEAI